ncbi:hypothetical protein [Reyranella sp.]|uniref:hypothetical protein n=1 Tax=Reyranella sp. TaxID=1929291 RepID=UPI003BA86971
MNRKGVSRKPAGRLRVGRRTIDVPAVPSMTDAERSAPPGKPPGACVRPTPIDRTAVHYLDSVRAVFRPRSRDGLAPGLERFIGREDTFRHVGMTETASEGTQPMMQCPPNWPGSTTWVSIRDLEILEILEDQDVRAG